MILSIPSTPSMPSTEKDRDGVWAWVLRGETLSAPLRCCLFGPVPYNIRTQHGGGWAAPGKGNAMQQYAVAVIFAVILVVLIIVKKSQGKK